MIKLIHITDPHLPYPGTLLHGLDPHRNLDACLRHVERYHDDAHLIVVSGDLTENGDVAAYTALEDRLADIRPPMRLMLGNHDDRATFRTIFPGAFDNSHFLQSVTSTDEGVVVTLDTLEQGRVEGHLCAERLAWLDARLSEASVRPVFLFLHHPPFDIQVPSLDSSRLMESEGLLAVLRRHGNVRYIFAGHVHRQVSGLWHGIPFSTLPGTSHQSAATFGGGGFAISFEPPAYSVIFLNQTSVTIHQIHFLEDPT